MPRTPEPRGDTAARAGEAAERAGSAARGLATRIARSFRNLESSQRLSGYASLGLVATMFLPWYSKSVTAIVTRGQNQSLASRSDSLSAWTAFSFVEAATLLVAAGVLLLLFRRGEGRAFHLPGGDGSVIAVAGGWASFLIFYRLLDQPDAETTRTLTTNYGLRWGIFFALGAALFLASTGVRLRAARLSEPPLPGDPDPTTHPGPTPKDEVTRVDSSLQPTRVERGERPRARATGNPPPVDGGTQLSFDEDE
ncbi:hypothetical protein [Paraconexibacter sp.]|uniref:hypothetical protein n=1 Tax=Paraconexibacter sp. TaxID=2949640 RepID=UPI00356AF777